MSMGHPGRAHNAFEPRLLCEGQALIGQETGETDEFPGLVVIVQFWASPDRVGDLGARPSQWRVVRLL